MDDYCNFGGFGKAVNDISFSRKLKLEIRKGFWWIIHKVVKTDIITKLKHKIIRL